MTAGFVNQEAASLSAERIDFSFGANWQKYLRGLNSRRVADARASLHHLTGLTTFEGRRFIDVGCGSGVFSLCAHRLGAASIVSIDVDPNSVHCVRLLHKRSGGPAHWQIRHGSVLDQDFLRYVQPADIVYSWGVLHHTGAMWQAIEQAMSLVLPGGMLCLALYNYPRNPQRHMQLKRLYNRLPRPARPALAAAYAAARLRTVTFEQHRNPLTYVRTYAAQSRGMSFWRDVEDWLGGLPCEFAAQDEIAAFAQSRGFLLEHTVLATPGANNEYRLRRVN